MRADNKEWNQPKRKKCVAVNKAEKSWRSKEHFNIKHDDAEWSLPSWFWSCCGPVFHHSAPFPSFGIVISSAIICELLKKNFILRGLTVKRLYESQKKL